MKAKMVQNYRENCAKSAFAIKNTGPPFEENLFEPQEVLIEYKYSSR